MNKHRSETIYKYDQPPVRKPLKDSFHLPPPVAPQFVLDTKFPEDYIEVYYNPFYNASKPKNWEEIKQRIKEAMKGEKYYGR